MQHLRSYNATWRISAGVRTMPGKLEHPEAPAQKQIHSCTKGSTQRERERASDFGHVSQLPSPPPRNPLPQADMDDFTWREGGRASVGGEGTINPKISRKTACCKEGKSTTAASVVFILDSSPTVLSLFHCRFSKEVVTPLFPIALFAL